MSEHDLRDLYLDQSSGRWHVICSCGWEEEAFPNPAVAAQTFGQHAYEVGYRNGFAAGCAATSGAGQAVEALQEKLSIREALDVTWGTCDWGDCDEPAVSWRHDEGSGWLPVCAEHRRV